MARWPAYARYPSRYPRRCSGVDCRRPPSAGSALGYPLTLRGQRAPGGAARRTRRSRAPGWTGGSGATRPRSGPGRTTEHVPYTAHSLDQARFALGLERAPQVADEHFQHIRIAEEIVAPDASHDRGSRQHLFRVVEEEDQQIELPRGQVDVAFTAANGATGEIDNEIGIPQCLVSRLLLGGNRGSPQERLDAGQKFLEIEWFDEVIVGSGPQSGDAVGYRVARGEHQDGDRRQPLGGFRGTQAACDLKPVDSGHHHV